MTSLEAIALHGIGDFLLQSDYIAAHKLTDWRVRLLHVALYCLPFAVVLRLMRKPVLWFIVLLALSHYVIDSRRWCSSKWEPRPIIVDQVMHLVVLAALCRISSENKPT